MKKSILITLVLFICVTCFCKAESSVNNKNQASDVSSYLLSNVPQTPVNSMFLPVMIYCVQGNNKQFVGVGSLFEKDGEIQIITVEHMFPKNDNYVYVYKYLTYNTGVEQYYGIKGIKYTGKEITGEFADVTILSDGKANNIKGFSIHNDTAFKTKSLQPINTEEKLVSLASGKSVKILGTIQKKDTKDSNINHLVIDYVGEEGESGTGFVDQNDNIYILLAWVREKGKKYGSIVYGPL